MYAEKRTELNLISEYPAEYAEGYCYLLVFDQSTINVSF